MDIESVIQILHERRKGFDILAVPYERKTHFAKPAEKSSGRRIVVDIKNVENEDDV